MPNALESPTRRGLIAGSGAGLLSGLGFSEITAHAATAPVWSNEYWAKKGGVPLYLYRKRVGAPKREQAGLPVLFLVHGSSNSSRPSFDLTVAGRGEYSVMNTFARLGFDVWTMDHENYGRSGRTDSNSDIASGVEDLKAGIEVVTRETGQEKIHFFGESSGALRAGAFAMARPERVGRLMLAAFTYKGEGSSTLAQRAKQLDQYRASNRRLRDRDMIRSIFTRDKAGTSDPAVGEALADLELKFGDQVPTGTYLDMIVNLPIVDPAKVQVAGAAAPRRVRRHRHGGRSGRILQTLAQRRPAVRDPAGDGAFGGAGFESRAVLALHALLSDHAQASQRIEPCSLKFDG